MNATELATACYQEKEKQLTKYMSKADTMVGAIREKMKLSEEQLKMLYELMDTALTDTYLTLFYALEGETCLGNRPQEMFKLYNEAGTLISDCGELEAAAYEAFYEKNETDSRA